MQSNSFYFGSPEGPRIFVRQWLPAEGPLRASVLVAHGAAEHGQRYERLASVLTAPGYAVYAPDHRGHGHTAGSLSQAGNAGIDGFNGIIRDLRQLANVIRELHPSSPLFLFGHSMGAALSQRFIQLHGSVLQGVILSGSPGLRPNLDQVAVAAAKLAMEAIADQPSALLQQAFATYNQGFENAATGHEWLSRDMVEVQKYVADTWCGFAFTNRLVADMSQCALESSRPENVARIPKSLPVFLFSGTHDRVGGNGKYVERLAATYRDAGIADVMLTLYPEGRHEMLNETNREEVHRDVLRWLFTRVTNLQSMLADESRAR